MRASSFKLKRLDVLLLHSTILARKPVLKLNNWIQAFHKLSAKVLYIHKVASAVLPSDDSNPSTSLSIPTNQSYASAGITSEMLFRFVAFIRILEIKEKMNPTTHSNETNDI